MEFNFIRSLRHAMPTRLRQWGTSGATAVARSLGNPPMRWRFMRPVSGGLGVLHQPRLHRVEVEYTSSGNSGARLLVCILPMSRTGPRPLVAGGAWKPWTTTPRHAARSGSHHCPTTFDTVDAPQEILAASSTPRHNGRSKGGEWPEPVAKRC